MSKFPLSSRWQEINCLVPVYCENGGNSTLIKLEGKRDALDRRRLKTVMQHLCRVFAVDAGALRRKYASLVLRSYSVPLPLHPLLVLVPVRMRKPQAKDQGAWGYLVKDKVADIFPADNGCSRLKFKDGSMLTCRQALESVREILNAAEVVLQAYRSLYLAAPGAFPGTGEEAWSSRPCSAVCSGCTLREKKPGFW